MRSFSRYRSARRRAGLVLVASVATLALVVVSSTLATASPSAPSAVGAGFTQVNLVSDVPHLAQMTDFHVSNPWGIALGPTTPLWVNNNNSATSIVYSGANGKVPIKRELVVETPAGPTGIAFNNTTGFTARQNGTNVPTFFLFNGFDGYTSAWGPAAVPFNEAIPTHFTRQNGYLGMAVKQTQRGPRMYAVTFTGKIQVFDGHFNLLHPANAFVDPRLPDGMAPYNVRVFGRRVLVAYADANGGPGGAISVFRPNGNFVRRLTTDRHLNAPWGMAIAPEHWGAFGKDLLVGNVNNGRISAFDMPSGRFQGQLQDGTGHPIKNSGLWGLTFGNGKTGTPRDLLFAAGIDNYAHGLVGLIHPN